MHDRALRTLLVLAALTAHFSDIRLIRRRIIALAGPLVFIGILCRHTAIGE